MKTKLRSILAIAIVALTTFSITAYAQKSTTPATQLPAAAQAFIKNSFKGVTIASAQLDKEMFDTEYKAYLSNAVEIEFDEKGQWKEIDGHHTALPATALPAAINTYINTTYKGQHPTQIEKKRWGYEVELANGLELEFDTTGKFLRVDD